MTTDWTTGGAPGALADLGALRSPALLELRSAVFDHVRGSWCTEQKARLLIELVVVTRPAVCVEIGAFSGSATLPILAALRHVGSGHAYVIEPWSNEEAVRGLPPDDANAAWWSTVDMATVRAQFDEMLETWALAAWCEVLAQASAAAAPRLPPIDLLHLDGNFSQEGAQRDSDDYVPKVVPGGHVVLSNVLATAAGTPTKMRALWPLFDACDIVGEVDGGNTLVFRKR